MELHSQRDNDLSRVINYPTEITLPHKGLSSCWFGVPNNPPNNIGYGIALGCLPLLEDRTLLLKTLHTFVIGLGETKVVLAW